MNTLALVLNKTEIGTGARAEIGFDCETFVSVLSITAINDTAWDVNVIPDPLLARQKKKKNPVKVNSFVFKLSSYELYSLWEK